ncbi:MAG: hypothetical protein IPH88_00305 [Bacteroidales bacterium]|nr:hypothetical protein [Bacteroidales bacterium]
MESYILSKSTYIRGLQCHKSLYLNRHRPYLRDKLSEEQLAKFARGHQVGKIAQQLFPGGIEVPRPGKVAAQKTADLITEGCPIIYEACFIHNEVIVALDILVKDDLGWKAYEVKSSGQLSETYFRDARLQRYVIEGSGLSLQSFHLIHRDLEKDLDENIPLSDLFLFTELEPANDELMSGIENDLQLMKEVLLQPKSPSVVPGSQCMKPYPCDFRTVCWKYLTEGDRDNLLNLNL